jgi:uncharacterized protein (TIGR00255 family)
MAQTLCSMTGFARSAGAVQERAWSWELRSVNSRGLDVRLKLPSGWEAEEPAMRQAAAACLRRGAVQAQLGFTQESVAGVTVRQEVLDRLMAVAIALAARIPGAPPPRAEALLALPGVVRVGGEAEPLIIDAAARTAVLEGFEQALAALVAARQGEGARLGVVLAAQIDEIAALAGQARAAAGDQHLAQQQRLQDSLRSLLGETPAVAPERVAQELALLASRADVREELDRLDSHVAEARALLAEAAGVGRRLDFLVQEFLRETNTLCSKSATATLTAIGLRLKSVIEQLREQVQNIE